MTNLYFIEFWDHVILEIYINSVKSDLQHRRYTMLLMNLLQRKLMMMTYNIQLRSKLNIISNIIQLLFIIITNCINVLNAIPSIKNTANAITICAMHNPMITTISFMFQLFVIVIDFMWSIITHIF